MLVPLLLDMVQTGPAARPTAAEALERFQAIRQDMWAVERHWRVRPREEPLALQAVFDTISLVSLDMLLLLPCHDYCYIRVSGQRCLQGSLLSVS